MIPVKIIYPVPVENVDVWTIFKPFVKRFTDSLREFDPGCEFEAVAIPNVSMETRREWLDEIEFMFSGIPWSKVDYSGKGCDIGSFQHYAQLIPQENVFMVCCVTRVYAWREGWLEKLVNARGLFGPGIYGTCASREGGKLHVCTRCYAMDSDDFKRYPHQITSRDQGTFFEVYDGNIYEWFKFQNLAAKVVYHQAISQMIREIVEFDGDPHPTPDIYRRGEQNLMLVLDKHTDAYRDASPEEKTRLERMCFKGELL